MRGSPEAHEMVAPGNLAAVLSLLAEAPGEWIPIAGGTELMVMHSAGRLAACKLVSLWGIPDLRFIETTNTSIAIGAGSTFRDLRAHPVIVAELPLLAKASTWIGSIANQSRATLGGNLVNGSPAADSSPALLVYDADVELVSIRGTRRIPYSDFHTGYKRNVIQPAELLYAVHLPRRFGEHRQYLRKVGTRRAMAVAKVALAATASVEDGVIGDIRVAAASLAAFPTRLFRTEAVLKAQRVDPRLIQVAREQLLAEAKPIDDIRSTAEYRKRVAANLVEEFLCELLPEIPHPDRVYGNLARANSVLDAWNRASVEAAMVPMFACCGARRWAVAMALRRPIASVAEMCAIADKEWNQMEESDWMEAFACHPRIGERKAAGPSTQSETWSRQEQASAEHASGGALAEMARANNIYERRFGFTYIVCATDKSVEEMLKILTRRLENDRAAELREAAEQQRQIMQIRLKRWLEG